MYRYFRFLDYYIEVFAKRLGGRGLSNPNNNGEFKIIESIVKNSKGSFCFLDGGSNVGEHILKLDSICKDYGISDPLIFAVEPFPLTIEVLKKNLSHISYKLIDKALGKEEGVVKFYSDSGAFSGQNSAIQHYYLNSAIDVEQITIDAIVKEYDLKKIDFIVDGAPNK